MSLDVYVTPLWRFKSGDVETAVEAMFGSDSTVVTPSGILSRKRAASAWRRFRAKGEVRRLLKQIERELGFRPEWNDDGDTVFGEQTSWGFEGFRCFAKWLDVRDHFERLDDPPENNFYKHPVFEHETDDSKLRFSHIINHSCYSGYFLPCEFDRIVRVEPHQVARWTFYNTVGSTQTLAKELDEIEPEASANSEYMSESTAGLVQAGFDTLRDLSDASLKHNLPIVFWG